jgi:sirohydrochlorin ferrochelatase
VKLVLTAHGSADPRSAVVTHAVAAEVRRLRPNLDVRVAFCERSEPNLVDVLAGLEGPSVVTPLLLASAFHARVDIPAMIAESGREDVLVGDTLGEDPRLIEVLGERLAETGVAQPGTGVLIVAVGSSHAAANAATATLADSLPGEWADVRVVYATTEPSVADGIAALRERGALQITMVPWFIAPGRITDRVAAIADSHGVVMAEPLGAHPLLAATVLDRFDLAVAARQAA